jgi:hypothetical protein
VVTRDRWEALLAVDGDVGDMAFARDLVCHLEASSEVEWVNAVRRTIGRFEVEAGSADSATGRST